MEGEQQQQQYRSPAADHSGTAEHGGGDPNTHAHTAEQNPQPEDTDTDQNHEPEEEEEEEEEEGKKEQDPKPLIAASIPTSHLTISYSPTSPTRRSISMGDFKRVGPHSEPPSVASTAPSSKLVTPSSSMEFEAARRRLLEVEERQRVIHEMERRLEELREVFVRSEQEAVEHGELVARISASAQQGELIATENTQRLKKRLKRHRPAIVFSSMLGLRTCLPWPVKLK